LSKYDHSFKGKYSLINVKGLIYTAQQRRKAQIMQPIVFRDVKENNIKQYNNHILQGSSVKCKMLKSLEYHVFKEALME
jgi:peptide methionine sulfoxide reductase MsrB